MLTLTKMKFKKVHTNALPTQYLNLRESIIIMINNLIFIHLIIEILNFLNENDESESESNKEN